MEQPPLIAERIKEIIETLKKGPMKWSELTKLGIPEKTLHRILIWYLEPWGLVKKRDDGRWSWFEHIKVYETREDYEIALKHSEELFLGFDAILAEEVNLWLLLRHPLADIKGRNIVTEGSELKPFAEEHLKTGYPDTYEKLTKFREALSELQKLERNLDMKDVFSHFKIYREDFDEHLSARFQRPQEDTPKPIKRFREQRLENFRELADHFLVMKLKVKMGTPLRGSCQLCPSEVHVKG